MIQLNRDRKIEITKELKKLYEQEPPKNPQRLILRTNIMGYELGAMQQYTSKAAQENLDTTIKKGWEENAKLGMADLIIQCRMLCLDCGWNFDRIQVLGLEHLKERHDDFRRDGFAESCGVGKR